MKRLILVLLVFPTAALLATDAQEPVVLLAGFSPYDEYERNVSIEGIRPLAGKTVRGHTISVLELPVSWEQSAALLLSAMEDLRPRLVIASGIDPSLKGMLIIESAAKNRTVPEADELGALPPGEGIIITGGAPQLAASVPVKEMLDRLESLRIPAAEGTDAGSFVCNWVFYHLLDALAEHALGGFIHIAPDMDPGVMQAVWIALIQDILDAVSGYRDIYCFTITQ